MAFETYAHQQVRVRRAVLAPIRSSAHLFGSDLQLFPRRHRTPQTRKYAIGVVARGGEERVTQDAQSGSNQRSEAYGQGGTRRIVMRQLLQFLHVLRRGAEKLSLHPFLGRAETEAAAA